MEFSIDASLELKEQLHLICLIFIIGFVTGGASIAANKIRRLAIGNTTLERAEEQIRNFGQKASDLPIEFIVTAQLDFSLGFNSSMGIDTSPIGEGES